MNNGVWCVVGIIVSVVIGIAMFVGSLFLGGAIAATIPGEWAGFLGWVVKIIIGLGGAGLGLQIAIGGSILSIKVLG